jgi:hypothetical protein
LTIALPFLLRSKCQASSRELSAPTFKQLIARSRARGRFHAGRDMANGAKRKKALIPAPTLLLNFHLFLLEVDK